MIFYNPPPLCATACVRGGPTVWMTWAFSTKVICVRCSRGRSRCATRDCCSGGGGDAAECSSQAAPVNAEHLERRRMSSRHSSGPANGQTRGTKTPSNEMLVGVGLPCHSKQPHFCAFHHINPTCSRQSYADDI